MFLLIRRHYSIVGDVGLRLGYKEDIADFLPIDSEHHNALKVYQNISGANKVFAIFQYRDTTKTDPDAIVNSIDAFVESWRRLTLLISSPM